MRDPIISLCQTYLHLLHPRRPDQLAPHIVAVEHQASVFLHQQEVTISNEIYEFAYIAHVGSSTAGCLAGRNSDVRHGVLSTVSISFLLLVFSSFTIAVHLISSPQEIFLLLLLSPLLFVFISLQCSLLFKRNRLPSYRVLFGCSRALLLGSRTLLFGRHLDTLS